MTEINAINIIEILVTIGLGFFAGLFVVFAFNRLPAEWLCDYGERPSQELTDPNVKRVKENPWRWVCAAALICVGIRLISCCDTPLNIQLTLAGMFFCWVLLVIGIADKKYMIIPDQMIALLALSTIGFFPLYKGCKLAPDFLPDGTAWNLLIGMVIGGGVMLLSAGVGALITKREAVGFGDVKLCAAIGLALGTSGILVTLLVGLLASGVYAAVLLAARRVKKNDEMPLGPFLCAGAAFYIIIVVPFLLMYN